MDPLSYIIGYKQGEANSGGSGDINVVPITITENGLKIAPSGKAYSPISVNVENSYNIEDEGKVVSNGALVAQTAHAEISANGTYDTTLNDEVTINVSGGGSAVVQPLSVAQNGTYNPPSGVDGYAPVTVNVSGGGSDVIISNNPPTSGIGVDGQYYIYEEDSPTVKYGIQIIAAARGTNYAFTYWGVRDIDFVFTDGTDEYHLRDFSNATCYWANETGNFAQQDSNINGQTGTYYEHSGLPGRYEISADVPAGLALSKVRICGRNDIWKDFWRTFEIGQWFLQRVFANTLISEQDLVLEDWDTSSSSAYTEFVLQSPAQPIRGTVPHLYRKIDGVWTQYS